MSTNVGIDEAQAKLKEIIAKLGPGDEVVIMDKQLPVAKLVSAAPPQRQPRVPGFGKGMITIVSDDDEHLKDFAAYMP